MGRAAIPRSRPISLLVTCEHGGNRVPAPYRRWFAGHASLLASHRGYDPGALTLARSLARAFDAPLVASTVSRLVVDLNRSPGHRKQFSAAMLRAPASVREQAALRFYRPHREAVDALVLRAIDRGFRILHVASHSFTPVLDGVVRDTDVGLLYDPARAFERSVVERWQRALRLRLPSFAVHRNAPYRGTDDGLTTSLRKRYGDEVYAGIEIEVNQKHLRADPRQRSTMRHRVVQALGSALDEAGDVSAGHPRRMARSVPGASSR